MKYISFFLFILFLFACQQKDLNEPGIIVSKTVEEDTKLPQLEINGGLFHLETFGDINNPILILLHGGPGGDYRAMVSEKGVENASPYPDDRTMANAGLTRLQDEYYCIFYDQQGAGLSPRHDRGSLELQDYIDDLNAIVEHFLKKKEAATNQPSNKINLFGWSFGGYLATAYINQFPKKVKNVVVYEPRPFTEEAFDLLELTNPFEQIGEGWVDQITTASTHLTPDSHVRADYLRAIAASNNPIPEFHEDPDTPYWRLGAFANSDIEGGILKNKPDITSQLINFQGNLLFLYGERTEAAPDLSAFLNLMTSYYPRSERQEVKGTAHSGPWEKPEEVTNHIRDFLE